METRIELLDVVAVPEDLPQLPIRRGQVGTVVEILDTNVFEVEFSDNVGRTYAQAALRSDQLIVLRYEPAGTA
jgi:hypothetical protein